MLKRDYPSNFVTPDKERRFPFELKKFEHQCLIESKLRPAEIEERIQSLRTEFGPLTDGRLDFALGASWHRLSNDYQGGFLRVLAKAASVHGCKIVDLTPEQVRGLYADFGDRREMEAIERRALASYRAARTLGWKGETAGHQKPYQAALLEIDVLYRHWAATSTHPKFLDELEQDLRDIADKAEPLGIKRELQMLYLLRKWVREQGLSHIVRVEHGLPFEDSGTVKNDVKIVIGEQVINIDFKSYEPGPRSFGGQEERRTEAQKKVMGLTTLVVVINGRDVQEAYDQAGKGSFIRDQGIYDEACQDLVKALQDAANSPQQVEALGLLPGRRPKKENASKTEKLKNPDKRRGWTMNEKFSEKIPGQVITAMGLLEPGAFTVNDMKLARRFLFEKRAVLIEFYATRDELMDPKNTAAHAKAGELLKPLFMEMKNAA